MYIYLYTLKNRAPNAAALKEAVVHALFSSMGSR